MKKSPKTEGVLPLRRFVACSITACCLGLAFPSAAQESEPTNAEEAAARKAQEAAEVDARYEAWVKTLSPEAQAWETVLQSELGGFYLPLHKKGKVAGKSSAWDFVEDDPALPRVLLIGDSVSRAYTQTVRKELAGKANIHRAPANCGPTATGLKKLDVWLGDGNWDIIHFNFGIHDRATAMEDYRVRLEELVRRMKVKGAEVVWASTTPIPDVSEKRWTSASIVERNEVAAKVMAQSDVLVNDLYAAILPRLAELQNPEDVHFNGAGNEFLGQQVASFLEPMLGRRFSLIARASEINPKAKEHPEISFVFNDAKGNPKDLQHAVVDTRVEARGQLVIWLMGHNEGLFERISSYGLHGIQPHYANGWFSALQKEDLDETTRNGEMRLEAATGEDVSSFAVIPRVDSIAGRSLDFLKWLAAENPEGDWEQFLNEDQTDLLWDKVVLSGISHGSTTAARFAKHQEVARVVAFSGPRDQLESWHALPSATPANRYFGFTHVLDGGWVGDHYCRSWQMLGLAEFGPVINVGKASPPFGFTRRLITDGDVDENGKRAHNAVVPGKSAIRNADGEFIHEAVWEYLFTHPVEETGNPVALDADCQMDLRS